MPRSKRSSEVLTVRVSSSLRRSLDREARRRRRTQSELVRDILEAAVGEAARQGRDPVREARRQSLLVSGRASERDTLACVEAAGDSRGWR